MKQFLFYLLISTMVLGGFTSCSHYKRIENATRMVDLARNPFMKRLAKSVISDMHKVAGPAESGQSKKIGLTSNFIEVVPSNARQDFYSILSKKYNIDPQLSADYSPTWHKVRDVIGFVAQHGSGFQLYLQ